MSRAALILFALLAFSACGKKGDPDPPQPDQFPHQYPKPEALPELPNGQVPGPSLPTQPRQFPTYP